MKDYHRILEISTDATEEQIRTQYKRLVRIYHPDRFTNSQDKAYVEQKLKDITEAYHELLATSRVFASSPLSSLPIDPSVEGSVLAPKPMVLPTLLDFGQIPKGVQRSLQFQLLNDGGIVRNLQLHYENDQSWFKVTSGRRLHKNRPFPMVFAVIVDTNRLQAGKVYHGWIRIEMDEAVTQLSLATTVVKRSPFLFFSPRITLALSMVLLLIVFTTLQFSDSLLPILSQNVQSIQPMEIALPQPTATIHSDSMEKQEAALIVIQPAVTPLVTDTLVTDTLVTDTPVMLGLLPSTSPANIIAEPTIQPEMNRTAPSTEIRGRTGAKSMTPNALLLPPVELWARTVVSDSLTTIPISTTIPSIVPPVASSFVATSTQVVSAANMAIASSTEMITPTPTSFITISETTTIVFPSPATATATFVPTSRPSPTSTQTSTRIPISTSTPANTGTPTSTNTPTSTDTPASTSTPTSTRTPASTSTPTSTRTPTSTSTPTSTRTPASTSTPTSTRTSASTSTPTSTTDTPVSTIIPTSIATATNIAMPTSTLAEQLTSTMTPLPTVVAITTAVPSIPTTVAGNAIVLIPDSYNVNARADISVNADVLHILVSGTQWVAVGRTIDSTWLLIRLPDEQYAWVFTTTVITDPDQVILLPVVLPESLP